MYTQCLITIEKTLENCFEDLLNNTELQNTFTINVAKITFISIDQHVLGKYFVLHLSDKVSMIDLESVMLDIGADLLDDHLGQRRRHCRLHRGGGSGRRARQPRAPP